jgi:lycopene beta-cyclase
MNNYDYILVGAGASGLMMAYRMSKDTFFDTKKILIIDQEKKSINDRTWCFWEKKEGEWDDILVKSWKKIQFKSHIHSLEESILPYQYKMIRSEKFYDTIWKQLASKTNITFIEAAVLSIHQEENSAKVVTSKATFHSKTVINSVLFSDEYKTQTQYPVLQQHFVGFFIKTESETFDDEKATFMDFNIPQNNFCQFMYILPFSENTALFEVTRFGKEKISKDEAVHLLTDYLKLALRIL